MIKLNKVSKIYNSRKTNEVLALDEATISFDDYGMVAILGKSGCGKSTLLNLLGGIDSVTSGEILFCGENASNQDEEWWREQRNKNIGFVFQNYNLLEKKTVYENVAMSLELQHFSEKEIDEKVTDILKKVELSNCKDRMVNELSGGQQQRVAIARAIIKKPKVILADEPTGNLDSKTAKAIFNLLREFSKECVVIFVTHDEELANEFGDRIVRLNDGKIESDTVITPRDAMEESELADNETGKIKKSIGLKLLIKNAFKVINLRKFRMCLGAFMLAVTTFVLFFLVTLSNYNTDDPIGQYIDVYDVDKLPVHMENYNNAFYMQYDDGQGFYIYNGYPLYKKLLNVSSEENIAFSRNMFLSLYDVDKELPDDELQNNSSRDINVYFCSSTYIENMASSNNLHLEKNTVYLTDYVANRMHLENEHIGNEIMLNGVEVTFGGIVKTDYDSFKKKVSSSNQAELDYLIKSEYDVAYMLKDSNDLWKQNNGVNNKYFSIKGSGIRYQNFLFGYASVETAIAGAEIVSDDYQGKLPSKRNEIMVSKQYAFECGYDEDTINDIIGKTYNLFDLYDKKYGRSYYGLINLRDVIGTQVEVVGVYEGDKIAEIIFTDEVYNEITEMYYTYISVDGFWLMNSFKDKDLAEKLRKQDVILGDDIISPAYLTKSDIDENSGTMIKIFVICVLTSISLMISLISYNISDNKKEVGILRTLGMSERDVTSIFAIENSVMCIIGYILALIGIVAYAVIRNNLFREDYFVRPYDILHINVGALILCTILVMIFFVLVIVIPIKRLFKRNPGEIMR